MTKQLTQNAILDRILKFGYVNWRQLLPIQPGNLKQIYNYSHLEQSIHKHGFAQPFAVWEDPDGNIYTVDGHTRIEVLSNIEGVPEELPAFWVDAKDRTEAAKILLEVYNQKHNPIDAEVMLQWLEVEEIAVEEVNLQSLNTSPVEVSQPAGGVEGDFSDDGISPDNKYGVIVKCLDSVEQEKVFNWLSSEGYDCKIVVV